MDSMGVIRVSDAAERFLYEQSRMGDTFDRVLRRLHPEIEKYDAIIAAETGGSPDAGVPSASPAVGAGSVTGKKKRASKGTVAAAGTFKPYILLVLRDAPGHKMPMVAVLREVEKLAKPKLTALDYDKLPNSGIVRWENRAQWDRALLVNERLLEPPSISGRGIWQLTPAGVAAAKSLK